MAIVSVDGLRPDALSEEATPNVIGLARRGAYTWRAQTVLPSVTLPAHASMLTGFDPSAHGITWDEYQPERGQLAVLTIFAAAHRAGLRTVLVAGKSKFQHLNVPGTVDAFVLAPRGDADVVNEAMVQVDAGFDLLFVHLPATDWAGHARGWMSSSYLEAVGEADRQFGRLLAVLPAETTVILTADHGGRGTNHGSSHPEDVDIPWVLAGPRVRVANRELRKPVRTIDTAATALWLLGLAPPSGGCRVTTEAFESD